MSAIASGAEATKQYQVLVTGFGVRVGIGLPFLSKIPQLTNSQANKHHTNKSNNPSGEIAAILPSELAADHALNVSGVDIRIIDVKDEWTKIDVGYKKTREAVGEMHQAHGDQVDLWVHLGRMGESAFYACERRAYSQDFASSWGSDGSKYYSVVDNADQTAHDIGPNPWAPTTPLGLNTDLDIDQIVPEADKVFKNYFQSQGKSGTVPYIRSHVEAGGALCGFVYYESMAHLWTSGRKRHAIFCHVPPQVDQETLEVGRDVVLAVIGASVAFIIAEGNKAPVTSGPSAARRRFYNER